MGKYPYGQISIWAIIHMGNYLYGAIIHMGNYLSGQLSIGAFAPIHNAGTNDSGIYEKPKVICLLV
jgi:hypothetical protein